MKNPPARPLLYLSLLMLPLLAYPQESIDSTRRQVDILAGILREGLDLNDAGGFPGLQSSRVQGVYLAGQGVLMDVRAPLASQRNQFNMNILIDSIRGLSRDGDAAVFINRPAPERNNLNMALDLERSEAAVTLQQLRNQIQAIDYQRLVESAVREANAAAGSLHNIGAIDNRRLDSIREELDSLRQRVRDSARELRQYLEAEDDPTGQDDAAGQLSEVQQEALDRLRRSLDELQDAAAQRASDLRQEYEQARALQRQRWLDQVAELENELFSLLCNYGATLGSIPPDEKLTVRLLGLGEPGQDQLPTDRIHVLSLTDLRDCQAATIDVDGLRERAASYSY